MKFDAQGKLVGIDGNDVFPNHGNEDENDYEDNGEFRNTNLKKSDSLAFLNEKESKNIGNIFDHGCWSLYRDDKFLAPLKFSNGKTQEDVVREIYDLIKLGHKTIFLHGTCGTGKSAIALNLARLLGKSSIVVPVKALQRQYEEDYTSKMNVLNKNGKRMKIAMLTGRDNHDSLFKSGASCADPTLPENIKISEKNYGALLEYYKENPYISNSNKDDPELKNIRRISVAPANPYWGPILPAELDLKILKDAQKHKYMGANGKEWIFYHRKYGCSYYDQYLSYSIADVIIFNSAKYLSELDLGRKPATEVEIIDEADDFLDGLFQQQEINISRAVKALDQISSESVKATEGKRRVTELLDLEEKNKRILGVDESKIYPLFETKLKQVFEILNSNSELEAEIAIEEMNYANRFLEAARMFKHSIDDVYATFRKTDEGLNVSIVSTNLSGRFEDIAGKSKAMVFMSGTLHSEEVLQKVFKVKDYKVVEAETLNQGNIDIIRTGKEMDCRYSNFNSKKHTREEYLNALSSCMEKAVKPVLIHVHAFNDLPSEKEKMEITNLMSSEKLKSIQKDDKTGRNVSLFKSGLSEFLFSTKCSRGVDFPGKTCNSIIFTKYPNPNVKDTFWRILQEKHPEYFWSFYRDKAYREFQQRIYRAVRSKDDHVHILSPDSRVLDAVRGMQES